MLSEILFQIAFGWPAALLALVLISFGLFKKKYWLLVVASVLLIVPSYYLGGGPGSLQGIRFMPLLPVASAFAVYKKKMNLARLFILLPVFLLIYFLFLVVYVQLTQNY